MATNKRLIKSNDEGGGVVPLSFNTVTWTGNDGTQSITGVGFQPDFVWAKSRSLATPNQNFDSVRGATKYMSSNLTSEEATVPNTLQSFNSDGFTVGSNPGLNWSSNNYVAWCWKAGGAAVSNTDGTTTSQVSANTEAGFSIVTATMTSSFPQTIGHGLSTAPDVIIAKRRSLSGNWVVYHKDVDATPQNYALFLDTTDAKALTAFPWNNTAPTDSVFTTGEYFDNNETMVAYCFAEVAGFSKFGSWNGTGTSGNKQTIGFEPAFILIKETTRALDWYILDNKRNSTNPRTTILEPNTADAEQTFPQGINFESDGFSFTSAYFNDSGSTFIYMAFANQF